MRSNHLQACAVLLLAVLAGCGGGPKSSSTSARDGGPVPTNRITLNLSVESTEPGRAVARANLNDGKFLGASYRLDGGDYLRACMGSVCRNMADNDSVWTPDYIARFDYQPGIEYVVSFNRQEAQDAPDTRVALPPPFTIVTPANHQQVSDGDNVIVEWSPSGAPAEILVSYEGQCTLASGAKVYPTGGLGWDQDADGREVVDIDHIVQFAASNTASRVTRCAIEIFVTHQLQGHVDPAFRRGVAMGMVTRSVNLDYIPR